MGVDDPRGAEVALAGGNSSTGVVRVGDTVRKLWLPSTERTVAYMVALRNRGIDVPEPQDRDDAGRLVLEYVSGELAMDREPLDFELLTRIGALVRAIHEASAGLTVPADWGVLIPAERPDLLCHNDLASWNLVIDDERLVFIAWDGAEPSTRLWDLAYAAISFGHLFPPDEPRAAADRLAAFLGATHQTTTYGWRCRPRWRDVPAPCTACCAAPTSEARSLGPRCT